MNFKKFTYLKKALIWKKFKKLTKNSWIWKKLMDLKILMDLKKIVNLKVFGYLKNVHEAGKKVHELEKITILRKFTNCKILKF